MVQTRRPVHSTLHKVHALAHVITMGIKIPVPMDLLEHSQSVIATLPNFSLLHHARMSIDNNKFNFINNPNNVT